MRKGILLSPSMPDVNSTQNTSSFTPVLFASFREPRLLMHVKHFVYILCIIFFCIYYIQNVPKRIKKNLYFVLSFNFIFIFFRSCCLRVVRLQVFKALEPELKALVICVAMQVILFLWNWNNKRVIISNNISNFS